MLLRILSLLGVVNCAVFRRDQPKIAIGNDDGWATANIRSLYKSITQAGYQAILSAPAYDESGTGSSEATPVPLNLTGEFGTISNGAPAIGTDPNDPNIYYVNSYPATAIAYGIVTAAPHAIGGAPGLVLSGVNVGSNLGTTTLISGTVGAASKAISMDVPAIAFSGAGGSKHVYTQADPVADVYAQVATKLVQAITGAGAPYLPPGIGLNVNIPLSDSTHCTNLTEYSYILSRVNTPSSSTVDVNQCGTTQLPTESSVIASGGCRVSVSVFDGATKLDATAANQTVVRNRLVLFLRCM